MSSAMERKTKKPSAPSSSSSDRRGARAAIPKAVVTESNGEISCSVEETNRIRALLGMKPLNIAQAPTAEEASAEREQQRADAEEAQRRKTIADLERRVAKAKRKRMLSAKMEGQGLGDALRKDVGELSAAEWIARNRRKTVEEERLLAAKTAQKLAAQEAMQHSAADLAGVAVRHDARAFEAGKDTVLTLADRSVLDDADDGEGGGAARADVLQNENLADDERTKELLRIKRKAGMPVYEATDDHEFEGVIGEKRLLRQYDEERDSLNRTHEHKKKLRAAFVLDGSANVSAAAAEAAAAADKVQYAGDRKPQESLMNTVQATKIAEYYTQDELVGFKKKRRKKKKKHKAEGGAHGGETGGGTGDDKPPSKKKKKRRAKKPSSIADELEQMQEEEEQVGGEPGGGAGGGGDDDRGSRRSARKQAADAARAREVRAQRDQSFQRALDGANADRSVFMGKGEVGQGDGAGGAHSGDSGGGGGGGGGNGAAVAADEDEDDADLQRALARARALKNKAAARVARHNSNNNDGLSSASSSSSSSTTTTTGSSSAGATGDPGTPTLLDIAKRNKAAADAERQRASAGAGGAAVTMSFTSTSEFSRRLQTQLQEQTAERRAQEVAELKEQTLAVLKEQKELAAKELARAKQQAAADGGGGGGGGGDSDSDDDAVPAGPLAPGEGEAEAEAEAAKLKQAASNAKQLKFMRNEVLHSDGIAATLAMMRQTGVDRAAAKDDVVYAGRTNDPKPAPANETDRVKLIYKDKFGRVLTAKEAFRQQSYKFHGKGPGQKKREKTLRKYQEEQALKKNKGAGLDMVERIKQHCKRTGQAYVTLPGYK